MNSKQKGKRGENELVKILNNKFGEGRFKRVPFSGAITGGTNRKTNENFEMKEAYTSDIAAPPNFNFVIEHKFYAEANFWDLFSDNSKWKEWTEQVEGDATFVKKQPMVVVKYNRHDRIALVKSTYLISKLLQYGKIFISPMIFWSPSNGKEKYSVTWLKDLLALPKDFWFTEGELNG